MIAGHGCQHRQKMGANQMGMASRQFDQNHRFFQVQTTPVRWGAVGRSSRPQSSEPDMVACGVPDARGRHVAIQAVRRTPCQAMRGLRA